MRFLTEKGNSLLKEISEDRSFFYFYYLGLRSDVVIEPLIQVLQTKPCFHVCA